MRRPELVDVRARPREVALINNNTMKLRAVNERASESVAGVERRREPVWKSTSELG